MGDSTTTYGTTGHFLREYATANAYETAVGGNPDYWASNGTGNTLTDNSAYNANGSYADAGTFVLAETAVGHALLGRNPVVTAV
jgi:hypothetical protein